MVRADRATVALWGHDSKGTRVEAGSGVTNALVRGVQLHAHGALLDHIRICTQDMICSPCLTGYRPAAVRAQNPL